MTQPTISFLSESELDTMHRAALGILETTGVAVNHETVLSRLKDAGCEVSFEEMEVRFPPDVVDRYLALVPRAFPLGRREAGQTFPMTRETMYTRPQSGCPNVLDLETGVNREATREDVAAFTRLVDALDQLDFCGSLLYPWDVPIGVRDLNVLVTMLKNTDKHCYVQPYHGPTARYMTDLACVLRSSRSQIAEDPPFSYIFAIVSPLTFTRNELEVLLEAAEVGIPVMVGSTPIAGGTCPVTIAGQVLLQYTENLASLVLAQVLRPGLSVTYGVRPTFMDRRTANANWGPIEFGISTAAICQLAQAQGFLVDVVGVPTDSKIPDQQAGIEKASNAVLSALIRPNVVAGNGFIDTIMTGSFEQTVIDNDLCALMRRVQRGIEVDKDRLAEELIKEVGIGGNYLAERHTVRYFRTETLGPGMLDRQNRSAWEQQGSKDIVERARAHVRQILREHHPPTLDANLARELDSVYERARDDLRQERRR